jgi:hypothetical protein
VLDPFLAAPAERRVRLPGISRHGSSNPLS